MASDYLLENFTDKNLLASKAIREGFGEAIVEAAKQDSNVVVLSADLPGSLKLEKFIANFPERYIQVGVAEQNMAGIGTGLAHYGKNPFITSFAAFSPGMNFSQIRLAAMSKLPLKIVGSHYGLNVGKDGSSAQMESDVAMLKALPGMIILNPADANQAYAATMAMAKLQQIAYLRLTREKFPIFIKPEAEFVVGKAQKLLDGTDLTIIATGSMVYESLQVAFALHQQGKSVDFLNIHTIKPLDVQAIVTSAQKTNKVVVIEEHNIWGGLGESVARVLGELHPCHIKTIGINDTFAQSGDPWQLWEKYGLTKEKLLEQILAAGFF